MQSNYSFRIVQQKTRNEQNQKPKTKRDFVKMILNDQIKVNHRLQNQIIQKKIIKCYLHGSDRKFETENIKSKKYNTFESHKNFNPIGQKRFSLNLQAPNIIGKRNQLFEKNSQLQVTTYRGHTSYTRRSSRQKMKSCCNLRSSTSENKQRKVQKKIAFKIRPRNFCLQFGKMLTIFNQRNRKDSPKQWEDEQFLRQIGFTKDHYGYRSLSKVIE